MPSTEIKETAPPVTPAKKKAPPKESAEKRAERIIATWQERLKIQHIKVVVEWTEEPEDEEALASVTPSDLYDYATVRFRGDWPMHSDEEFNHIVVHELLHIVFRDYAQAVRSVMVTGSVAGQVQAIWWDRCNDAEEGLIDRLANRLVELGGVVS